MRPELGKILSAVLLAAAFAMGAIVPVKAQTVADKLTRQGDRLRFNYRFQEAMDVYSEAMELDVSGLLADSLRIKMRNCQMALNMMEFCATPHVVAKQRFSRKDFFQYYPLKAQSWRPTPNLLDQGEGWPTYFPKGERKLYFSAPDNAGTRSIFYTEATDSLWSAPRLLGESLTSTGSEVFPMLSPDGNTLYFASDGLYGIGGYDIFSCKWNPGTQSWSEPVNMGFPFNSPADDFLLMDTDDGKYTLFASNRETSADSVYVYVLDYSGGYWDRKSVSSREELVKIASLETAHDPTRMDMDSFGGKKDAPGSARLYSRKIQEARDLEDSIRAHAGDSALVAGFSARLSAVRRDIEDISADFLREGVVQMEEEEDNVVVGEGLSYTFSKHAMGNKMQRMKVDKPFRGTSYRITPIGRISQDNDLPPGLVYQIQFASSFRPLDMEAVGGLNPVYRRLPPSLKYAYYVGMFYTYYEALAELNVVRLCGFPDAFIVAWLDGTQIPTEQARKME